MKEILSDSAETKLNFSELAFPNEMSPFMLYAAKNALQQFDRTHVNELIFKLSRLYDIPEDHICIGAGENSMLFCAAALLKTDISLLTAEKNEYTSILSAAGCTLDISSSALSLSEVTFEDSLSETAYISSPNTVTGKLLPIDELLNAAEHYKRMIIDIRCMNICATAEKDYVSRLAESGAVIIGGFSYGFGMSALPLGYLFCKDIGLVNSLKQSSQLSASPAAIEAAITALDDEEHLKKNRQYILRERRFISQCLKNLSVTVIPSDSFQILAKTAIPMSEILAVSGIKISTYEHDGEAYYGIAPRNHEENIRLISTLAKGITGSIVKNRPF